MKEERLNSLLLAWQEQHSQGREVQPADLCGDCPELAEALQQRIDVLRQMNALLRSGSTPAEACTLDANLSAVGGSCPADAASPETAGTPCTPGGAVPAPVPAAVPGYEILAELGRGGMGVVYKARQQNLNRTVALKMILAGSYAGSRKRWPALNRRPKRSPGCSIPISCRSTNSARHEGQPYFSLEYLDGGTLAGKLRGEPQCPPCSRPRLVATLARAVQVRTRHGIIHRDLKPANVLLTANGIAKVTDFGLAKQGDSGLTASGAIMGTPSYMAPEQAEGKVKEIGPAADVYALGAILYEMLTGRPPFKGASAVDTLQLVTAAEPVPPSQLQPKVPRDLETVCLKCLRKEPAGRYGSAVALAEDLQRFLNGEPILARPVGAVERGWRWCRRSPVVASLILLSLTILIGALVSITLLYVRAEHQRQLAEVNEERADVERRKAEAQRLHAEKEQRRAEENAVTAAKHQKAAEDERARAHAEAAKANQISKVLTEMFQASDPLGLNGLPIIRAQEGKTLTARTARTRFRESCQASGRRAGSAGKVDGYPGQHLLHPGRNRQGPAAAGEGSRTTPPDA